MDPTLNYLPKQHLTNSNLCVKIITINNTVNAEKWQLIINIVSAIHIYSLHHSSVCPPSWELIIFSLVGVAMLSLSPKLSINL